MIIIYVCPDCHIHWHNVVNISFVGEEGFDQLTICCPDCHAARQKKLIELEGRYHSSEKLGLLGSITEIPTERYSRPHARGRRVMNKEERQG